MSTLATNVPITPRTDARPRPALITAAGVFAATALFDLIARPPLADHRYHAASVYTFTALLMPFALAMLWALGDLRSITRVQTRLAKAGLTVAASGLALFIPCAIASLATANPRALGALYVLAMLLSLVGTGMLSYALARAGALARWAAIALPVAWLIGGPIGEGGDPIGFRGAALLLATVSIAIATTRAARPKA
jgi:hypothetical protein